VFAAKATSALRLDARLSRRSPFSTLAFLDARLSRRSPFSTLAFQAFISAPRL
jgi:hypothetical protein